MEVNAIYTVSVYQVKFYVNGEFHSYQNVEHGRNVTLPNVAPLEGLTPVWDHDGNNIKGDLAIYCIYKINGYTVDKVAGTTGEVIPNGISYGYTYGNAIGNGKNEKLDLTKLNRAGEAYDLVFWSEATGEAGSFTLSVPEQIEAPVVEIDYVTGTTKDIIGTDVYYGTNENAMTTSGTNEKLTVIPGTTYYFYRPADGEKLPSDTTVVNVGVVPEAIEVTIDYVGGTTNEIIGSEVEFAVSDTELSIEEAKALEFSGRGCGEKLSPEKRENAYYMYFRIAATDENFAGDITKVYVGPKGKDPNPGIDYKNVRTKNTIGSDLIYGSSADSMTKTGTGSKISLTPGKDLYFQRKGSNEKQVFASDTLHLVVPERPVITRYGVRNETIKGKGDGRLYSLTKNVKYRWQKVGSSSYYTNTFTADYISIKPGEWKLRIQATDTSFASEYVYFTVEEGRTLSLTIRESKGGEILNVIEGLSYRKAIPVPEDPTRNGYVFDGWYWGNNGTESAFDFSLGISTDRTVYAKWIEVEEEVPANDLTGDKWIADFGTVAEGSGEVPATIDVTVTNNGKNDINILVLESQYYSVSGPETIA
ncbi:MAG: InlB B-repeat-containing protein, partial [Clostridia bacterium]|nr:InlB B-repeat-containing protein [Clostridia bacterium]